MRDSVALDRAQGDALGRFAEALGLAFQIADDVLDCDGNPDTTGKPLGTDLLDGTVTLPLILAAERDREVSEVIASGAKPDDVLPTLARVVASGAIADAQAEARRLAARRPGGTGWRDGAGRSRRAARSGADGGRAQLVTAATPLRAWQRPKAGATIESLGYA